MLYLVSFVGYQKTYGRSARYSSFSFTYSQHGSCLQSMCSFDLRLHLSFTGKIIRVAAYATEVFVPEIAKSACSALPFVLSEISSIALGKIHNARIHEDVRNTMRHWPSVETTTADKTKARGTDEHWDFVVGRHSTKNNTNPKKKQPTRRLAWAKVAMEKKF